MSALQILLLNFTPACLTQTKSMRSGELNLALLRNTGMHGVTFRCCLLVKMRDGFRVTGYLLAPDILLSQADRDWRSIPRTPYSITRTQLQRANVGWQPVSVVSILASDFCTRIRQIVTAWPLT